jgi:hypothetical protein
MYNSIGFSFQKKSLGLTIKLNYVIQPNKLGKELSQVLQCTGLDTMTIRDKK